MENSPALWIIILLVLSFGILDYIYSGMKPGYTHVYIRLWSFVLNCFKTRKPEPDDETPEYYGYQKTANDYSGNRTTTFAGTAYMSNEELFRLRDEAAMNMHLNTKDLEYAISRYKNWRNWVCVLVPALVLINISLGFKIQTLKQLSEPAAIKETPDLGKETAPAPLPPKRGAKFDD